MGREETDTCMIEGREGEGEGGSKGDRERERDERE
jgi:hypothetical protein